MTGDDRQLPGWPLESGDPARLGRYALLRRLGEGGMGRVYLARSPAGELVAVKVIRTDVAEVEGFRRRFRSEVARARQVPPFCTAEVLDADPDHDPPYLVVEYVDGPDLTTVVRERGPLRPAHLHGLAIGVATALTAIHAAGIIHRDLKPSNVLLAPGNPKVIDFGLARRVDPTAGLTGSNELIGTVAYMAPERIEPASHGELTPAADVFAWGAVVTFAGTGRAPFEADSLPAIAVRILTQPPDLARLDGDLRDLVAQALAKDPADRPSARELLDRLLASTGSADPAGPTRLAPTAADRTRPLPSSARPRWRRRLAVGALVLGLLAAGGGVAGALSGVLPRVLAADPGSPGPSEPAPTLPAGWLPDGVSRVIADPLTAPLGWQVRHDPDNQVSCRLDGGLVVTSQRAASYRCPGPRDELTDLAVSVDVTLAAPGSCASVWFRFAVATGGYALRVCQDGYYFVTHGTPEPHSVTTLRTIRLAEPIAIGTPTRIGLTAAGDTFRFYRDGQPAGGWSHSGFTGGHVALGILQMRPEDPPPYEVVFGQIEIWGRG